MTITICDRCRKQKDIYTTKRFSFIKDESLVSQSFDLCIDCCRDYDLQVTAKSAEYNKALVLQYINNV